MTELLICTSISDGIDRLTILNIKKKKIQNKKKLNEIDKERNLLLEKLNPYLKGVINYYYKILEKINKHIWEILDKAKYENITENDELKYYREQEDYNERRFRVKRMIDNNISSSIKEQKSYKNKKCAVLTHLGLGDHIYHGGMIRYLATIYDEIVLVCFESNYENLKLLFFDILNIITFYKVPHYSNRNHYMIISKFKHEMNQNKNIVTFFTGSYRVDKEDQIYDYPFSWYDAVNIDTSIFWDYNYIPNTEISNQVYEIVKDIKYVFMHNTCSGGQVFTTTEMEKKFNINRNNILFINPCVNIYPKEHKFFNIAKKFLVYKLCDYVKVIKNADYILVADSSFFGMCHHLENIKTDNVYYFNRGFDYEHLYSDKYKSNNYKLKRFKKLNINNEERHPGSYNSHTIGGDENLRKMIKMDINKDK